MTDQESSDQLEPARYLLTDGAAGYPAYSPAYYPACYAADDSADDSSSGGFDERPDRRTPFGLRSRRRRAVAKRLVKLGVTVLAGPDATVTSGAVQLSGGRELPSEVTIWTAGFGVPDVAGRSGLSTDALGRLSATRFDLGGRLGAKLKEFVCAYTVKQLAAEARKPGSHTWAKDDKRRQRVQVMRGAEKSTADRVA